MVLETFGNGILLYQNGYRFLSINEEPFIKLNIFENLLFLVVKVFDLGVLDDLGDLGDLGVLGDLDVLGDLGDFDDLGDLDDLDDFFLVKLCC